MSEIYEPEFTTSLDPGLRIWGLAQSQETLDEFDFYVVLETMDAQLDFSTFMVTNEDQSIENLTWTLA